MYVDVGGTMHMCAGTHVWCGSTEMHVCRHTCMLLWGYRCTCAGTHVCWCGRYRCTWVQVHMYVLVCLVFNLDLFMCLVYLHISVCTICVLGAFRVRRGCRILWNQGQESWIVWSNMWVLGTERRSSEGAGAHNHWTISPWYYSLGPGARWSISEFQRPTCLTP